MGRIEINPALSVDDAELQFTYSRSQGPGGQNVNKLETKATLRFDVGASASLSNEQRATIRERLASRITSDGILAIVCGRHRTQAANRRETIERFRTLLADALKPRRKRRKTKPSRGSIERRLGDKRKRSELKRGRGGRLRDE